MICPRCNNNLPDGVYYCPYCRDYLPQSTTEEQNTSDENNNGNTQNSSNEKDNVTVAVSDNPYNPYSGNANTPNSPYSTYSGNANTPNNPYNPYSGNANMPNSPYSTYSGNANMPNRPYSTYSGNANANNHSYLNNRINHSAYSSHFADNDSLQEEFPMTWYKILTYFLLPIGTIMNLYYAKKILEGKQYEELKEIVYQLFPSLKVVDTAAGVFCIFFALWTAITCIWLLQKKRIALVSLYSCLIVNYSSTVLLYMAYNFILPHELFQSYSVMIEVMRSVVIGGTMTWANYKYFHKRRDLFIN